MPATTQHLILIETATGAVTWFSGHNPGTHVVHYATQLAVERSRVIGTAHAETIAGNLHDQFAGCRISVLGDRPWYLLDLEVVLDAVHEFDLQTGNRVRLGDVAVGDRVMVRFMRADDSRERGTVTGICGRRFRVDLDEPVRDLRGVWAARDLIKPIVRVAA